MIYVINNNNDNNDDNNNDDDDYNNNNYNKQQQTTAEAKIQAMVCFRSDTLDTIKTECTDVIINVGATTNLEWT